MDTYTTKTPTLTLTLDPFPEEETSLPQPSAQTQSEVKPFDESTLTPEERKMVEEFSARIDLTNSAQILQYGAGAQKKVADFSDTALERVRTQDLGEIGEDLADLLGELKGLDAPEEKSGGLRGLFRRGTQTLEAKKNRYQKAEVNVERISQELEKHQIRLLKDAATLDQLYEMNTQYFRELSLYILAGKKKLAAMEAEELPRLQEKAQQSGLPEDAQAVNDLVQLGSRFEKKLHDLELTRMVSLQMAPQIRLVQNNDTMMAEKIQSTIVNTIPLWKGQMVLALGISHSNQAAQAQREVTDMTNALLQKNAETLKMASVETAKEAERGIVEVDTLKKTNEMLISTIDEVLQIQQEGREKRRQAETELARMEQEMKEKLLQTGRRNPS
ncbi:MAG: toxic anion resistance protein [Lachnospiraceae bacterium]|nr:toxic anion resistance protein [Lachnospiraceae bacterium]